ncbi:MAG: DUF4837 domain-containing protein [Flavobacteriaceae bacterium]|nr:DUF4837 domain-containing protein [Flavobacteriaceae bacterium]|tara:strand:+ start:12286 stop:13233 length:948 start_codon:yes stop_codon:yes gene_type:complete
MKRTAIILFFLILTLSCSENHKKLLPASSGNINNISVVTTDDLWDGVVGEALKENFSRPIYGLPQIEPVFSLSHIPSKVFSGFATKSRTILKLDISEKEGVFNFKNTYASPQRIIQITAKTPQRIIEIINENLNSIYSTMYFNEIKEKQRRISKNLNLTQEIKNKTGVSLKFPSAYRVAKVDTNFVWIRRDIETGSVNLFVYRYSKLNDQSIIERRDSISKIYIPGPVENTFMSTDLIYTPNTQEINVGEKQVYETRGLWEIEGQFMAGPFLNYQIKLGDNKNEYIMLDGFVYSPGSTKREYIFELEAIMRSLKN